MQFDACRNWAVCNIDCDHLMATIYEELGGNFSDSA
jgi:hypothetical protein